MIRRPRRSAPATIVAVVLLALCVLAVLAVVQSLLGLTPLLTISQLLEVTSTQQWRSAPTLAVAIVAAVLGVILLVVAIRPGKPTVMPLAQITAPDGMPVADAGVRRHTLAKDLTTTAAAVPGVAKASVTAGRARVTATVTTAAADPTSVPEMVRERLENRLGEIGPAPRPRVRVRARRDRNT